MKTDFNTAIAELGEVVDRIDNSAIETGCQAIQEAGKIVLYGCGREGLQMRGFAMRLYHLGFDVAVQGDMTTPPLGPGDLFIVSDGPGRLATVEALTRVAKNAGASVLLLTAEPTAAIAGRADRLIAIPAQTMAKDQGDTISSVLPMGSVYEGTLFLLFEIMVLKLRDRIRSDAQAMRARHTNLE
ncbi:SIS domain-containing protein [Hoeflea poritis]|uniref:SIS domain-containing protein n=1 Tax=Hoeflea poritis TaxID=2993659 RepID=A0ABT4VVD7_9HYPH|nr:SIS domain-containing protein [Hoeflea poritis]MDA4848669.1 SIS domain-containing protein [Hoeflea poritis]